MKRAKDVMEGVFEGRYPHQDLAMYHLHISAQRQHKKNLLKKQDLLDISQRIKIMNPPTTDKIPNNVIEDLPYDLLEMIVKSGVDHWKVEWMYCGEYFTKFSKDFRLRYGYNKQGVRSVYSKLVDTLGFSRWEIVYKMWLESLYRSGQVIMYEGKAFHADTEVTVGQVARMKSLILDYDHIITVTTISK